MLRVNGRGYEQANSRESGNTILFAVLLISMLAALAAAQFAVAQKNMQSSSFFSAYCTLRQCAESGINLGMHDLAYGTSVNKGMIGTANWTLANDYGRDGIAGTSDEGEGDGIPTPGEPTVMPVPIGPAELNAGLIVYSKDSAYPGIQQVVAIAENGDAMATVSTLVRKTVNSIPVNSAVYVNPNVALSLNGNSFSIDGRNHDMAGNLISGAAIPGLATEYGSPVGSNKSGLLSQVPSNNYDQILGSGGTPAVDEVSSVDIDSLFEMFKSLTNNNLTPGTHSSAALGSTSATQVTYVKGDLHLSGQGTGAGVLIVDGSLVMSGKFDFKGIVIVRGDVRLTGGGSGVHILGALMIGQSLTALEDTVEVGFAGQANMHYSAEAISNATNALPASYSVVYWDEK
jgi:hypothetical protein